MAELNDPFETELASYRPQPVSLELRERIGAEVTRRPIRWMTAVAGFAAAACVVLGIVAMWPDRKVAVSDPVKLPVNTQVGAPAGPPTVMDYQRAFFQSPDALEALLARPAGGERRDDARATDPVRAFSRSYPGLTDSTGD
jgi:hypothetical protein